MSEEVKEERVDTEQSDDTGVWRQDAIMGDKTSRMRSFIGSPLFSAWDSLVDVTPESAMAMGPELIALIMQQNAVARNAVEYPAADCLRNWFYLADEDADEDALRGSNKVTHAENAWIMERLRELEMHQKLYEHLSAEASTGSSLLYMDVNTKTPGNRSDLPVEKERIKKVNYINAWSQFAIRSACVNNYLQDRDYGKIISFTMKNNLVVHKSRVNFLATRKQLGSVFGNSVLIPLEMSLDAQRTLIWSIGEIAHSMLFKVLKSKNVDFSKREAYIERVKFLRRTLATNDLIAIGDEESLEFKTPGDLPRVQEMSNILWEMISCATRVPKSILLGKTEGKVAGAEYDHISYYIRLVSLQKNAVEPVLKWVIDALFQEKGITEPKYKIMFNPLWDVTDEVDAKIRKLESEVDLNVAKTEEIRAKIDGVLNPEDKSQLETKVKPGGNDE